MDSEPQLAAVSSCWYRCESPGGLLLGRACLVTLVLCELGNPTSVVDVCAAVAQGLVHSFTSSLSEYWMLVKLATDQVVVAVTFWILHAGGVPIFDVLQTILTEVFCDFSHPIQLNAETFVSNMPRLPPFRSLPIHHSWRVSHSYRCHIISTLETAALSNPWINNSKPSNATVKWVTLLHILEDMGSILVSETSFLRVYEFFFPISPRHMLKIGCHSTFRCRHSQLSPHQSRCCVISVVDSVSFSIL
jgi:hypothetical protein